MKIAYLIPAYNQPSHLFRMVEALNADQTAFFIHIDRKSDLSQFGQDQYSKNVTFIPHRERITHGGFSLVKAMIHLLKAASQNDTYDYFQFLTGWDYPIKRKAYIDSFLDGCYPQNFINFYPLTGHADLVDNVRKFYLIDFIGSLPAVLRKPVKALHFLELKLPIYRRFLKGLVPFRGSGWCCLNHATVNYILKFLDSPSGQDYIRFFEHVLAPDEIFFHTIIFNSPHAESCRYYDLYQKEPQKIWKNEIKAYLHYVDWDPRRENPAQLVDRDFDALRSSEYLYARKFHAVKSRSLLGRIDRDLLGTIG